MRAINILFITAGLTPTRAASNSYQEALFEGLAARGNQVVCLCSAGVRLRPGVAWTCDQHEPYKRYTVFNGAVYPALYSQGGVGARRPLRDVHSRSALRRAIIDIVRLERPDLVNIQSLFGLPFDVVDEIRQQDIPVVFTAHDYFALCPTAHLFLLEERPCRLPAAELICHQCCEKSPSYKGFWLSYQLDQLAERFSSVPMLRNIIWRLRNLIKRLDGSMSLGRSGPEPYRTRRREAISFLQRLDLIHCISHRQSQVLQEICGPLANIRVLPLMPPTINTIARVPRRGGFGKATSFVALNVNGAYKGCRLLETVFRKMADTPYDYELHIYGNHDPGPQISSVFYHGRYHASDLNRIAASTDFCIVPSVCDETLGFVGLEMLSRGVPVIASSRSGLAEFIVPGENGYVFDPDTPEPMTLLLTRLLESPSPEDLRDAGITLPPSIKVFPDHLSDIEALFRVALGQPTAELNRLSCGSKSNVAEPGVSVAVKR